MKMGEFEFDLNHFFRYVYGGFVLCLSIIVILPRQSIDLYNALGGKDLGGSIFFIFFIIAIGVGFYAFYKELISEVILGWFHFHILKALKLHLEKDCVFKYLENILGVKKNQSLTAFRLIRDRNFDQGIKKIFYLRHSEAHVLYLTFTACSIGVLVGLACYPLNISTCSNSVLIILSLVAATALFSGLLTDKKICVDECVYCRLIEDKITVTLRKAKLLPSV